MEFRNLVCTLLSGLSTASNSKHWRSNLFRSLTLLYWGRVTLLKVVRCMEALFLIFNVESNRVTSSALCFSMLLWSVLCGNGRGKKKGKCEHHGIAMGHPERLTNIRYAGPILLRCYLGSALKLAFGKLFRPWWDRKVSKATLSLWFIRRIVSNQSSPFSRTQPTIDRNILRCNTLMPSKCTFVNANVCKVKSMAGVTTALKNLNRNFKLTCL